MTASETQLCECRCLKAFHMLSKQLLPEFFRQPLHLHGDLSNQMSVTDGQLAYLPISLWLHKTKPFSHVPEDVLNVKYIFTD